MTTEQARMATGYLALGIILAFMGGIVALAGEGVTAALVGFVYCLACVGLGALVHYVATLP